MLATVAIVLLILGCLLWIVSYVTCGECKSKARMDGKTVIITGCTSGIGKATAFDLAKRGARLIMACRNLEKANTVKDNIVQSTKNSNVIVRQLELSSLNSVREFAEKVNCSEERLDVLIHNAGISHAGKRQTTEDGLNMILATNHFGPFLLTHLLIDLMKRTGKGRIVIVSSIMHRFGEVSLENPNPLEGKSNSKLYSMSKFANILFANELSRRLEGLGITANSLHPGGILTPMWEKHPFWVSLFKPLYRPLFKTEEQGAQTTIHLAVSEELEGVSGKYFADCREVNPRKKALDVEFAKKYWKICEDLVQLKSSDPRISQSGTCD